MMARGGARAGAGRPRGKRDATDRDFGVFSKISYAMRLEFPGTPGCGAALRFRCQGSAQNRVHLGIHLPLTGYPGMRYRRGSG
jgi:hypothetical protein